MHSFGGAHSHVASLSQFILIGQQFRGLNLLVQQPDLVFLNSNRKVVNQIFFAGIGQRVPANVEST